MSPNKAGNDGADTRGLLRDYYLSTCRADEHEPPWVHPLYEPVLSGGPLTKDHECLAQCLRRGVVEHDESLGLSRTFDKDGWKVGSNSWIFLRRRMCTPISHQGWSIINATHEGETYWMAYDAHHRVGGTALTDMSVGPFLSLDEVKEAIQAAADGRGWSSAAQHIAAAVEAWRKQAVARLTDSLRAACADHETYVESIRGHAHTAALMVDLTDPDDDEQIEGAFAQLHSAALAGVRRQASGRRGEPAWATPEELADSTAHERIAAHLAQDFLFDVLWAHGGFRHVTFANSKILSEYALTRVRLPEGEELRCPWPAFAVEFEPGALPTGGTYVRRTTVLAPCSATGGNVIVVCRLADGTVVRDAAVDIRSEKLPGARRDARAKEMARLRLVMRRIVACVMLALTHQANYSRKARAFGTKGSYLRRMHRLPETDRYVVGKAVQLKVDRRDDLRVYLRGTGGHVKVQTLVVGHRKHQAFGRQWSEHRWIFIDPHWRGQHDSPIIMRPHHLCAANDQDAERGEERAA